MDTTALAIVGSIIGIAMMVIAILNFYNNKNTKNMALEIQQAELKTKLESIEKELVEIKSLLVVSNEKYLTLEKCNTDSFNKLDKRITMLEAKVKKGKEA